MSESSNQKLTWIGLAAVGLLFIILQIKLAWTRSRLAKAEAKAKVLELDIEAEKQDAKLEKTEAKKEVIKERIQNREEKLNALYEKIGLLDDDASATAKSAADAEERLRRGRKRRNKG